MDVALNKLRNLFLLLPFLVACQPSLVQRPIELSSTPIVGKTDIQSLSPATPTLAQVPSLNPQTSTPTARIENPVLISYEHDANDSIDNFTACLFGLNIFSFILYQNGHVILFDGSQFMETTILQGEIEKLLADIESTGFFSVKGDGDEFVSPPPTSISVSTSMEIIRVKEKTFVITARQYPYLIEPIKETIQFVREYKPSRLTPYVPDKLDVWVYPIQDTASTIYELTPTPPKLEWSSESIPLDIFTYTCCGPSKSISGKYLQFVMQEFKTVPAYRLVKQNGQHYLIMTCPVFQ